jgi:hypothetical protein
MRAYRLNTDIDAARLRLPFLLGGEMASLVDAPFVMGAGIQQ